MSENHPFHIRYKYLIIVCILMLTFAGRLINIDQESLWVDEGFSYWAIQHDDMFNVIVRDVHPPFYFYMLRGWSELTGITELALRYLSVIPSLLSVAVIYHVARELERLRNPKRETVIPLLAMLLLALADMENYVAQETRMYTWHVLWLTLSMWAFLRWIRTNDRRTQVGWFGFTLALLYTQYIGLAGIAVQGIYSVLFLRGRKRINAIGTLFAVGLALAPWLLIVVSEQTNNVGTGFNVPSTLASLWDYRINWFTGQWALLIGLALFGLFTLDPTPKSPPRQQGGDLKATGGEVLKFAPLAPSFLMLGWLIVPVIGAYILNLRTPILIDYRLTQITPAVALLIAFGLGNIRGTTLGFLVAVILVYGAAIDDTPVPRPPWREVGMNATQFAQADDLALAHITPSGDWQVIYYYDRFMPDGVERRSLRQWQLEDGETYATGLPALLEANPHVWFMHWSQDMSGFDALQSTGHTQTAVMTEDWLGNDLNVYRFDVIPPEDEAIVTFESGMTLRDVAIHADDLQIDLWWSIDVPTQTDFTVSVILLGQGGVVAQLDVQPFINQRPTSTWTTDDIIYDPHILNLIDGLDELPAGEYSVGVKIYAFEDSGLVVYPTTDGEEFTIVGTLTR